MHNKNVFNPLVSIIIPVYNGSNYIKESIESALSQTYNNIEVIVVNDGSNDKTEDIAKSYDCKIKYYYKYNGGVASALNFGIKQAKGDYISWLSHDDIYYPNKIERQIEELKNIDNKNTILYCGYELINDKSEFLTTWEISDKKEYRKLNNGFYALLLCGLNGCSLLLPKKAFYEVDFFNEDLKCTQDYDLWFKIFKYGYKIKYIPETLLQYRIHESQDTKRKFNIVAEEGNKLWINMISNLDKNDYENISYNEYSILKYLKIHLNSTPYDKTLEFIDKRLNILESENKKYYEVNNKISIIIDLQKSYFNINKIIDSITAQEYDNIEIIFITNKNIDYIIKDLEDLSKVKYKVLNSNDIENILDYINGDFVQFINGNDLLKENKFKIQLEEFINDPSIDISYCNYYTIKNGRKYYPKEKSLILNDLKQFENILYLWNNPIYIPLCSILIKKDSLKNIDILLENDYLTISQLAFNNKFKFVNQTLCYLNLYNNIDYYKALYNEMQNTKFILKQYSEYICLDKFYKYKNELLINYFSKKIKRTHRPIFLIDKNISYIYIYLFCIKIIVKRSKKLSYRLFLFLYLIFHNKGDTK